MSCKCTLRGRLLGDGCATCNPELAREVLSATLLEVSADLRALHAKWHEVGQTDDTASCFSDELWRLIEVLDL